MWEINYCVLFFGLEIVSLDTGNMSLFWMTDIFLYIFLPLIVFLRITFLLLTTLFIPPPHVPWCQANNQIEQNNHGGSTESYSFLELRRGQEKQSDMIVRSQAQDLKN